MRLSPTFGASATRPEIDLGEIPGRDDLVIRCARSPPACSWKGHAMGHSNDRSKAKYPLFYAYGESPRRLTKADAVGATTEERIASVWFMVIGMILSYRRTMRPREAANFDPEDALA